MTFTDVKELTDLPVGGKVVLDEKDDEPWTKVDEEWMDNGSVRLRIIHFSGAIRSGHVAAYDPERIRRFVVRHGAAHYSLALSQEGTRWRCFTFHTANPEQMYHSARALLTGPGMGETFDPPDQVPWQAFTKALAGALEATVERYTNEVTQLRAENERLTAQVNDRDARLQQSDVLRQALEQFLD